MCRKYKQIAKRHGLEDEEDIWKIFNTVLKNAAREACHISGINNTREQTQWWNVEIKDRRIISQVQGTKKISKKLELEARQVSWEN